jgi:hypothetical protein
MGIILLSIISVAIIYLWPSPVEFPMDDTYIHFVYAENLSGQGGLFFNTPSEKGVGTSSIIWVLLLAAGDRVGLSMNIMAKILGISSLAVLGVGIYLLLRPIYLALLSLAASLLIVLSGHMLWFALSGMETVLFLALGILALLCYRDKHWGWLGILLGLLVLTRQEGVLLAIVIGLFDIWRYKGIQRGLVMAGLACVLISGPWLIYLWLRTGYPFPTSGIGKHLSNIVSIQIAAGSNPQLIWLSRMPWLAYPLTWTGYMIEFILGGFALPKPYLFIDLGFSSFHYRLSIWAIIGIVTVVILLLWLSLRHLIKFLRTPGWMKDEMRLPLVIFLVWMILNNLSYMIYLPIIGTASRYASLNHIALWIALVLGIWYTRKSSFRLWAIAGLFIIALANTILWDKVYEANLEHMVNVRIAAADYIRERIPQEEICGATDIGALRYFSQKQIADLGGLIDPNIGHWYLEGKSDQYLVENGITCLALPGQAGSTTDGVIDIAKELGLTQSKLFTLQQLVVFEIDRERWLLGYLPVINYQATVTVYRLESK